MPEIREELGTRVRLASELMSLGLFVLAEKVNYGVWESYGSESPPMAMAIGLQLFVVSSLLILIGSLIAHAVELLKQICRLRISFQKFADPDGDEGKGDGRNTGRAEPAGHEAEVQAMPSRRAAGLIAAGLTIGLVLGRAGRPEERYDS
ncbi:hypothetical protein ACVGOW_32225 [Pseudonocardia saturnea]